MKKIVTLLLVVFALFVLIGAKNSDVFAALPIYSTCDPNNDMCSSFLECTQEYDGYKCCPRNVMGPYENGHACECNISCQSHICSNGICSGTVCRLRGESCDSVNQCCGLLECTVDNKCCSPGQNLLDNIECYCDEECISNNCSLTASGIKKCLSEDCDPSLSLADGEGCHCDEECISNDCRQTSNNAEGGECFNPANCTAHGQTDCTQTNGLCCSEMDICATNKMCLDFHQTTAEGGSCYFDAECAPGLTCQNNICTSGNSPGPGPGTWTGATCAAGDGCVPGCTPTDPDCGVTGASLISFGNPFRFTSFNDLIDNLTTFVFTLGIIIAPLFYLLAAGYLIVAAGDPQKVATAKRIFFYTTIGLGIIMLGRAVIYIIKSIIGA